MRPVRFWWIVPLALAFGCAAPPPPRSAAPARTPTPLPLSRTNPNIIEEDAVHFVERLPKAEYIRVDDRHVRSPIIGIPVEFFKEDQDYYYVYTYKKNPELAEAERAVRLTATPQIPPTPQITPTLPPGVAPISIASLAPPPPASDFEDLSPARVSGRLHLEEIKSTGLPTSGQWRASFVMADMNGDGIPDIVAPGPRGGGSGLNVWVGDGRGHFSEWPVATIADGKRTPGVPVGYGAVAVGDIDGDGKLDIVAAQHGGGLASFFGDGRGNFRAVPTGLPRTDFSAQAIVLLDADGDGKLDIVASRDVVPDTNGPPDSRQVRVYLWRGSRGWEFQRDALLGGFYSYSLHAWDFDRDKRPDILTGSHYLGALTLLWRNTGAATFEPVFFPELEAYSLHFATAPGTFGSGKASAFADAYAMQSVEKKVSLKALGITVYSFDGSKWTRHRVWRKKAGRSTQYALAMGDLDGDGLDDIVFPDSDTNRLRVFFQQPDGSFREAAENEEPVLNSTAQCVRLVDLDGDGRLDVVLAKTVVSYRPEDKGGWSVYLNRR